MLTLMAATMLLAAPPEAQGVGADDARLAARFAAFVADECRRHPAYATGLGNHEYDDRLDDLTPAARAADAERTKQLLAELGREFAGAKLGRDAKIDLEIWTQALKLQLWQAANIDEFATDPRVYVTFAADSVYGLFAQSTLPKARTVASAAKRIAEVPKVVAAAKLSLKNPPKILTEVAIQRAAGAAAFYDAGIFELAGESPGTSELAGPAKLAAAAMRDYEAFLRTDVLPRSTGEWRLGKAKFAEKLALELDSDLAADEVVKRAEAEAIRVEREMHTVARQLWGTLFPGVVIPVEDDAGRRELVSKVLAKLGEDKSTIDGLLGETQKTVAKITAFIRERNILTLPDPDRCRVIEMPEFQRGFSAAYLNPAPPLDPQAASLYAVSPPPSEWPEPRRQAFLAEYNRAMLQILTIHEAYPGHYVQLEYANRHPSLVRKVYSSGTFAEGWAVYTEQVMLDQGYAADTPAVRLHQLKFYLRAVLNAILDHRMHCDGMTDAEALKLLTERGYQTEGEAVGKVARAKQSSAQLSTYFVGRTAFVSLREQVQRTRGAAFDLAKYHEEVLSHGSIAVKYLPGLVK